MPEQIKPTFPDEVFPRIAHDVANFFPVPGPVAMHLAVFAGRLRIQRAFQPAINSIMEKTSTLDAAVETTEGCQFGRQISHRISPTAVMIGTKNRGKKSKDLEILAFFSSEVFRIIQ